MFKHFFEAGSTVVVNVIAIDNNGQFNSFSLLSYLIFEVAVDNWLKDVFIVELTGTIHISGFGLFVIVKLRDSGLWNKTMSDWRSELNLIQIFVKKTDSDLSIIIYIIIFSLHFDQFDPIKEVE